MGTLKLPMPEDDTTSESRTFCPQMKFSARREAERAWRWCESQRRNVRVVGLD